MIFQLLCKDKSDWDDNISGEVVSIWKQFLLDVEYYDKLSVKRFSFVEINENVQSVSLQGFCDSSLHCYCGVLYLRVVTSVDVKVCFLAAKTKVAPLKELSIAWLELLGCVLLSSLVEQVKVAISERIDIDSISCWSDSQVALCWLKGKTKTWKPWVENRVVKVRKIVDSCDWFYVRSSVNPADIPTRICEKKDFERWFKGPDFLFDVDFEPEFFDTEAKLNEANVLSETRKSNVVMLSVTRENGNSNRVKPDISQVVDINRIGELEKLINTTAYVLRFVNNLKNRKRAESILMGKSLTAEEIE